jgi:hypothetical protein
MFQPDKILSLVVAGMVLLMFTLSTILFRINRKKIVFATIISVLYAFFAGYYIYLSFCTGSRLSIMETEINKPKVIAQDIITEPPASETQQIDFWLILQVGDNTLKVAPEDEIEIKKSGRFKIKGAEFASEDGNDNIKVDLKGFAGNVRVNDGQDIGYWINYDRVMKHWSVEGEKDLFEIIIKKDKEPLGSVYVRFVD